MRYAVRYYTRSGNTEKLANAIAAALNVQANNVWNELEDNVEVLFLGCSYYAFDVDDAVKEFIVKNRNKIGKIVCFGTSAMMKSTHKPLKKICDSVGVMLADKEFHCRGSFGPMHKGRPNQVDLQNASTFVKNYL